MTAEILRKAAALMREQAEAATPGPWTCYGDRIVWPSEQGPAANDPILATMGPDHDDSAEHIASWHPAVALAVADLLDLAAGHEKREGDECGQGYSTEGYGYIDPSCSVCGTPGEYAEPWPCVVAVRGLALARAYLGNDQ